MSDRRSDVVIERATVDEGSFRDVFELLIELHKEGGYASMDIGKAVTGTYATIQSGAAFLARKKSGEALGVIGLQEVNFWYSHEKFLQEVWFYVRAEYRKGLVGTKLLGAAKSEADARNMMLFVSVTNPDRKPKKTNLMVESLNAGYVPVGYTLKLR